MKKNDIFGLGRKLTIRKFEKIVEYVIANFTEHNANDVYFALLRKSDSNEYVGLFYDFNVDPNTAISLSLEDFHDGKNFKVKYETYEFVDGVVAANEIKEYHLKTLFRHKLKYNITDEQHLFLILNGLELPKDEYCILIKSR